MIGYEILVDGHGESGERGYDLCRRRDLEERYPCRLLLTRICAL